MKGSNFLSIILGIFAIVAPYFAINRLEAKDHNLVNIASIIGTSFSIFGLLITLVQIFSLKAMSKIIEDTVDETKGKLSSNMSISDITKTATGIESIQRIIRSSKKAKTKQEVEAIISQLQGVKSKLIELESSIPESERILRYNIAGYKIDINVELSNVIKYSSDQNIDWQICTKNLKRYRIS